jgi:hypothetical protein
MPTLVVATGEAHIADDYNESAPWNKGSVALGPNVVEL